MTHPEQLSSNQPSAEVDLSRRRELALRTTDAVSEVLEQDVSIAGLQRAVASNDYDVRVTAKRALRCIALIAEPNSEVVKAVGETEIYHFVEGVMLYGADTTTYLGLMDQHGLEPSEATGMYTLRNLVAEYTNGTNVGFPTLKKALSKLGITVKQASADPDAALESLSDSGFIIDHKDSRIFNRPILAPNLAEFTPLVEDDTDGTITAGKNEAFKTQLSQRPEEVENDIDSTYVHGSTQDFDELLRRLSLGH